MLHVEKFGKNNVYVAGYIAYGAEQKIREMNHDDICLNNNITFLILDIMFRAIFRFVHDSLVKCAAEASTDRANIDLIVGRDNSYITLSSSLDNNSRSTICSVSLHIEE